MSIIRRMDNLWKLYTVKRYTKTKKVWTVDSYNTDKSQIHYVDWKKPDTKCTYVDPIYMRFKNRQKLFYSDRSHDSNYWGVGKGRQMYIDMKEHRMIEMFQILIWIAINYAGIINMQKFSWSQIFKICLVPIPQFLKCALYCAYTVVKAMQ